MHLLKLDAQQTASFKLCSRLPYLLDLGQILWAGREGVEGVLGVQPTLATVELSPIILLGTRHSSRIASSS